VSTMPREDTISAIFTVLRDFAAQHNIDVMDFAQVSHQDSYSRFIFKMCGSGDMSVISSIIDKFYKCVARWSG
jgi:hypothetical protein